MAGQHARVQPSGLERTVQCPASLLMQEAHPGYGDDAPAQEGEAAHYVAQHAATGTWAAEGSTAPNGVVVTDEMIEGAQEVVDTITADLKPYGMTLADVAIEQPVSCPRIHPECWGTPDYRTWVPASRTPNGRPKLFVWDYKFGHGVVEAQDNYQLAAYASGCISATRLQDTEVDVVLGIIQPRSYHHSGASRWWATTGDGLRATVNIASNAAHEALGDNPRTRTGNECGNCSARHACTTLQRAGYSAADRAGQPQPMELPPDALGLELRTLMHAQKLLEARVSGLQEQAVAMERAGRRVSWFKIERSPGRMAWTRPVAEVIALGQAMGVNVAKPVEAITPTQAIKAGLPEALVTSFATRPMGAAKLVPDDGSAARRAFA